MPDEPSAAKTVSLPVVESKTAPRMGATRTGRWRAALLLLVNLLIVAHIIQWLIMGSTLSPVEPSESMLTLETGVINAGAILFALALLATLVFGRFFCGWLCHVVALQDACAWLMNRIGIRPKPFRSRLLVFVPLVLGLYMFVWPTFKRLVMQPAFLAAEIEWPAWLKPVAPINVWQTEMIVEDFWATFGSPWIAIPFLLICGFVTVYFLGAKGFCTYACPYGGLFAPVEQASPVRIRVTDACQHCGHCTSVCTSNVQVAAEVHDFGMVVDPGCMKCMDCVNACPSDALYLGLGAPAVGAKPRDRASREKNKAKAKRRYDMTWPQELAAAGVFIACFFAFRGMLDQIAMLLAGGIAAIVTFLIMTAWFMVVRPNARIYGVFLKQKGRIRPTGVLFSFVVLGLTAVVAWGANARYNRWRVDIAYAGATIPAGFAAERAEFALTPEYEAHAEQALAWLNEADSFRNGGLGWSLNPEYRTWKAYYLALLGRKSEAADELEAVIEEGTPGAALIDQLVRLRIAGGMAETDAAPIYERAIERHPDLHPIRRKLALLQAAGMENPEAGLALFESVAEEYADDIAFRFNFLSYFNNTGRQDLVIARIDAVADLAERQHNAAGWLADLAGMVMRMGDAERALSLIDRAVNADGVHPGVWFAGAEVAGSFGQSQLALERIDRGLAMKGVDRSPSYLGRAAGLLMRLYETERAVDLYRQAADAAMQPFEKSQIGQVMANIGRQSRDAELASDGLAMMRAAAEKTEQPVLYHDLAVSLYRASRLNEAAEAMQTAAELGRKSPVLALRAADMWRFASNPAKAAEWDAERERREAALGTDSGTTP